MNLIAISIKKDFKQITNQKINFDNLDFQFENAIKDFAIRNEIDLEWQI